MKILITGAAGKLAKSFATELTTNHDVLALSRDDMDITDFNAVKQQVLVYEPDIVLHPAAWTDVDGCARDPLRAVLINGLGTQNVAVAAANVGAAIVYISSNEVFDGLSDQLYFEYDATNPANPYGYSKWVGEQAVKSLNPRHYIVRTSWVFAHGGRNFIHAILNAAHEGKQLRVVTDEIANPTYNDDLVAAVAQLIQTERYGIYHFANEGAVPRYDFARHALDAAGYDDVPVERITIADWPRPSTPPPNAGLANMAGAMIGITLRPWQKAVDAFLEKEGLFVVR